MTPSPRPFGDLTAEAPLEFIPSGHGYHLRDAGKRSLWAKITGSCGSGSGSGSWAGSGSCPSCAYTWVEVSETGETCDTEDLVDNGTLNSFPAYEINGNNSIAVGTIVRLHPSRRGPWYTFSPGGSGTGFEFCYIIDDSPIEPEDSEQIYYNATIPQWVDADEDWEEADSAAEIWFTPRVNQPCSKGDIIMCRIIGTANPEGEGSRPLYAGIRVRCIDPITIQSNNPVEADGNKYWPARVQYWDNTTQERKEGRAIWVIDWLNEQYAFRAGDHIIGYWIGDAEPGEWLDEFSGSGESGSYSGDGSGSGSDTEHAGAKPLYMTFCSGINTRFLKCFENNVLARNGTIANIGTRVAFLDENCEEATSFEGICLPEE